MAKNGWAKYTKASTGWVYVYVGFEQNGDSKVPISDADRTADGAFAYTATTVNEGTYSLFTEFSIAPNADISAYGAAKITLTAVAIQDEGFGGDLAKVWAAVTATYPYIHTGGTSN